MSIDFFISDVKKELLFKGSEYLYTLPTNPKIIEIKSDEECIDEFHIFKTFEIRYGLALMILKICTICLHSENEVFPPIENRMVINH